MTGDFWGQQSQERTKEEAAQAAALAQAKNAAAEPDYATKRANAQADQEAARKAATQDRARENIAGQKQKQGQAWWDFIAGGKQRDLDSRMREREKKADFERTSQFNEGEREKGRQSARDAKRDAEYGVLEEAEQIANQIEPMADALAREGNTAATSHVYQTTAAVSRALASAQQEKAEIQERIQAGAGDPNLLRRLAAIEAVEQRAPAVLARLNAIQQRVQEAASRGAARREAEKGRDDSLQRTGKRVGIMGDLAKARARLEQQATEGIGAMRSARSKWTGDDPMLPIEKLLRQWADPQKRGSMRPVDVQIVRDWLRKNGGGDEELVAELEALLGKL
mgnify:FL=1